VANFAVTKVTSLKSIKIMQIHIIWSKIDSANICLSDFGRMTALNQFFSLKVMFCIASDKANEFVI